MNSLEEMAIRYKQTEKDAVRCLVEGKFEEFTECIQLLKKIKDEIKVCILERPLVQIVNVEAAKVVKSINENAELPLEKCYKNSLIGEYLREEFTDSEITEIGSDIFYSWFSHYEYVKGMSKIGAIIINCGKVPKSLECFVAEARQCYAFQQYNAVFSLSRTILEVTLKELSVKHGILPKDDAKLSQIDNYKTSLNFLIDELSKIHPYRSYSARLHWIRRRANFAIHGNKVVTEAEAAGILKETMRTVSEILEVGSGPMA